MSDPFRRRGVTPEFVSRAASWVMAALVFGALGVVFGVALERTGQWPEAPSAAAEATEALADRPSLVTYADTDIEAIARPAVESFAYDWETNLPGWQIEFVPGEDRIAGYTWSREHRIEIFVRDHSTTGSLERVLAHEVGHAIDVTLNDTDDREAWQAARGIEDEPWWPESGAADFETGAGDFAESVAYLFVTDDEDFRSLLAAPPSELELALLSRLIEP